MESTEFLRMNVPEMDDPADISKISENMYKLDKKIEELAKRPGFSGDYNDLVNKPALFSGDYRDLKSKPSIPVVPQNVSAFSNDVGYATREEIPHVYEWAKSATKPEYTKAELGLSFVDNTADMNKPVSEAQQEAINAVSEKVDAANVEIDAAKVSIETINETLENHAEIISGKVDTRVGYDLISNSEKVQITTNRRAIDAQQSVISDIRAELSEISEKADQSDVEQLQADMLVQTARMDQLVDTEASADEVIDARVMANGKAANNLGNAIRTQISETNEAVAEIDEIVSNYYLTPYGMGYLKRFQPTFTFGYMSAEGEPTPRPNPTDRVITYISYPLVEGKFTLLNKLYETVAASVYMYTEAGEYIASQTNRNGYRNQLIYNYFKIGEGEDVVSFRLMLKKNDNSVFTQAELDEINKNYWIYQGEYTVDNPPVMYGAHRGYLYSDNKYAVENSIWAMIEAKKAGFNMMETDFRKDVNGQIVCIHDDTVDRLTDGTGKIENIDYTTVHLLDKDGEPTNLNLSTIEELITMAKALGMWLMIDGGKYDSSGQHCCTMEELIEIFNRYNYHHYIFFNWERNSQTEIKTFIEKYVATPKGTHVAIDINNFGFTKYNLEEINAAFSDRKKDVYLRVYGNYARLDLAKRYGFKVMYNYYQGEPIQNIMNCDGYLGDDYIYSKT